MHMCEQKSCLSISYYQSFLPSFISFFKSLSSNMIKINSYSPFYLFDLFINSTIFLPRIFIIVSMFFTPSAISSNTKDTNLCKFVKFMVDSSKYKANNTNNKGECKILKFNLLSIFLIEKLIHF